MHVIKEDPNTRAILAAIVACEERPGDPANQTALVSVLESRGDEAAANLVRQATAITLSGFPPEETDFDRVCIIEAAELMSLTDTSFKPAFPQGHTNASAAPERSGPPEVLTVGALAPLVRSLFDGLSNPATSSASEEFQHALSKLDEELRRARRQPDRTTFDDRVAWLVRQQLGTWFENVRGWATPPFGSGAQLRRIAHAPESDWGPYFHRVRTLAHDANTLLALARYWSRDAPHDLVMLERACVLLAQNIEPRLRNDFIEELGNFGLLRAIATLHAMEEARVGEVDRIFLFRVRDAFLDGGRADLALNVQQRICDRWPENPDEFVVLGEIAIAARRRDSALLAYRKVLVLRPGHDRALSRLEDLASQGLPEVESQGFGVPVSVRERRSRLKDPKLRKAALDRLFNSAGGLLDEAGGLTGEIIRASDHHWHDISYYASLGKVSGLMGRKKRDVRTIALYYWRLHDGGTERVTSRLARMWHDLGYRVLVLTDEEPSDLDYDCGPGVERFVLPPHRERYVERGNALARLLRTENVDLFVSNLWVETATSWDLFVAKSLGIPVVIGWHNVFDAGIYNGHNIDHFQQRLVAYRYADLVVTLSTMDQYWFSVQGIASRLVHNPLTFTRMPERRSPLSSKQILWMGRVEQHQKRIEHVIRMMPLVLQNIPDASLMIVGDGPDRSMAQQLARQLGVESKVRFVGYSSDVEGHIRGAAVHVMTSEFEGSPMVISEAWSHGVPTVMYDLPFLEFLRGQKGFISVDQLDYESLGREVSRVLSDNALRVRLGNEARQTAQVFFDIDLAGEWKRVFDDLRHKDDMSEALTERNMVAVAPFLTRHLADRMYAVDARAARERQFTDERDRPDPEAHTVSASTDASLGRTIARVSARMSRIMIRLGADALSRRPKFDFRPLNTIDLAHIGLGDNLMAWVGLHALLSNGHAVAAAGCSLYVPTDLAPLAAEIFTRYDLRVRGVAPHTAVEQISPVFSPLPPEGPEEWMGAFLGADWRMNCFEALDEQKTLPRPNARSDAAAKLRLGLSQRILYRRSGWYDAEASYIGYRLWLPVARELGVLPLNFLALIKTALRPLRAEVRAFVDTRFAGAEPGPDVAVFPAGKSFQAFSPESCARLRDTLPGNAVFFVQDNDPWISDYRGAGITPCNLPSIEDLFWVVRSSKRVLTTDSFSSHVAQLLRDDFVLALTRDFKENIVHPGANPLIRANHPACAPCNYTPRTESSTCVAGFKSCIAFGASDFIEEIADALMGIPVRIETHLESQASGAGPNSTPTMPIGLQRKATP